MSASGLWKRFVGWGASVGMALAVASCGADRPAGVCSCAAKVCGAPDGCGGICEDAAVCSEAAPTGVLAPLYAPPDDRSWSDLVSSSLRFPRVRVVAVVNPQNGPGAAPDPAFVTGIQRLQEAGIAVLGYTATDYGRRSEAEVLEDVRRYRTWYPRMNGVFFDEQGNTPGGEQYYAALTAAAKARGFGLVVANPGTDSLASYVPTADVLVIHGAPGLPRLDLLERWAREHGPARFAAVPYAVPMIDPLWVEAARPSVGFLFVTDDVQPNPWDTLPPYLLDLLAMLSAR